VIHGTPPAHPVPSVLAPHELTVLAAARKDLVHPGIFMKLTDLAGKPIKFVCKNLPADWQAQVGDIGWQIVLPPRIN
jgi:hypothetical protein